MSRRLLTAGFSLAALLGALAWPACSTAKSPDLPLIEIDVLAPQAPPVSVEVDRPSPDLFSPAAAPATLMPLVVPVRPSVRRMMASCLLFGAHPLLALAPTETYVDFDEEDNTGSLLLSVGFNSDTGFTGTIEMNPPATGALSCGEGMKSCRRLFPHTAVEPEPLEEEQPHACIRLQVVTSDAAAPEVIREMPKEIVPNDGAPSVCPWMRQQQCPPDRQAILFADPDLSHDVLENLQALRNAQTLLQNARELGRAGSVCEAMDCLELAHALCPGSWFEEKIQQTAAEIFAPLYCGSPRGEVGGEEESEPTPPKCSQERAFDLMKQFNYYYKEGKYKTAESCAAKARELDPENHAAEAAIHVARQMIRLRDCERRPSEWGAPTEPPDRRHDCEQRPSEWASPPYDSDRNHSRIQFLKERAAATNRMEREIEHKLSLPATMTFENVPLRQVIDDLRSWQGVNIYVDQQALDAEEVSLDRPVSVKLENVSLKSCLKLILSSAHLTYVIKDEVLMITTERGARGQLHRITYEVADLLDADIHCQGAPASTNQLPAHDRLIKLITSTISPKDWSESGGTGTIDFHPLARALVVNQTADVQEQVADLLAALRRQCCPDEEEEQRGSRESCPGACEKCEELHRQAVHARAETLMQQCHQAMDAGQTCEAAGLARQAFALDAEQAGADPLVYKMHLLADAPLQPCLPPVDPEVPAVLNQLYPETTHSGLISVGYSEEQEPPAEVLKGAAKPFAGTIDVKDVGCGKDDGAPTSCLDALNDFTAAMHPGSAEFGVRLDGSVEMFTQFRRGSAIWHMLYRNGALSVWASPDGGADMPSENLPKDDSSH